MSIDKKGFKYRLSNVLAWSAFGGVFFGAIVGDNFDAFMAGVWVWIFVGLINYLMVGNFRMMPWKDIE